MSGRGSSKGSSQSSRGRGRGRGRAALSSEHTLSPSPTTSTPDTSQVAPTTPPATTVPSPPPAATDAQQVDASPQLNADSSHASQPDPSAQQRVQIPITWDGQKGFDPDNNDCTQAISDVIELMLNEPWLNYSEIPEDVQKRWFEKRGLRGPQQRASRSGRPSTTGLGGVTSRSCGISAAKRQASSKANRASSKGGCLHTRGSATIPKTRAKMTRSLDRPATDAEVFRATHMRKRDRSIVEKRADDLLTEFSANLEQATQQAQEEGDESAATVDPDVVWRQTLSKPCKNRVYGAGGFFASSLRRSGYGGSFASASSTHTSPAAPEVVDLQEQVQNLSQSLQTQGHMLQQHIDKVRTLKDTLAERDARAEEHLRRMEEMQRQMAAFYDPLRPGSSAAAGGSGSSTAPPLPPCPPPRHPAPEDGDDDDDYEDA
ncbi:hypothetical protein PIB30_056175 [Stylosanthes scabra]|uniref:Uncharacterized protein n=1 Tax=Stylosanthes scabra TaxID=79078 RepID=A0ABU6SKG0_9FABA|nr:hypothetical protein [Stylosanthes scabra]